MRSRGTSRGTRWPEGRPVLAAVVGTLGLGLALGALGACGGDDGGAGTSSGADAPVDARPRPPETLLLPGDLPDGYEVTRASITEAPDGGGTALLAAPEGWEGEPGQPVIVVGSSSGSASIAGPGGPGEPVEGLGDTELFDPYVVDDGPWTWVVYIYPDTCIEDCISYVAGKGVDRDDLVAVARATTYGPDGPEVPADGWPDGMTHVAAGQPPDGLAGTGGALVSVEATGDGGAGGELGRRGRLELRVAAAPPELAWLWGFWVDDPDGSTIRGNPGWSGRLGATVEGADTARVWVEDGLVLAAEAWDMDDAVVDAVVDGLRPATTHDLTALTGTALQQEPTVTGTGSAAAVASGVVGDHRWTVQFDGDPAGTEPYFVSLELTTGGGSAGASGSTVTLGPVGALSASGMTPGGTSLPGRFVYGAAPPGTAAVELLLPDGRTLPTQLLAEGPRDQGERWFATFDPAITDGTTAIARDAAGTELARAPA